MQNMRLTIHLRLPDGKPLDASVPASKVSAAWYVCRQSDVETAVGGGTRTERRELIDAKQYPYAVYHACGLLLTWRTRKQEAVALCRKLAAIWDGAESYPPQNVKAQIIAAVQAA